MSRLARMVDRLRIPLAPKKCLAMLDFAKLSTSAPSNQALYGFLRHVAGSKSWNLSNVVLTFRQDLGCQPTVHSGAVGVIR